MKKCEKECDVGDSYIFSQYRPQRRRGQRWLAVGLVTCSIAPVVSHHAWAGAEASQSAGRFIPGSDGNWLSDQIRLFRSYPHLDRAYKQIAAGKYAEACEELKVYLEIVPQDHATRMAYVSILHKLKRFDLVLNETRLLLDADPGNSGALFHQAMALQAKGKARAALDAYESLLAASSLNRQNRLFVARAAADLAVQGKHYDEALTALDAIEPELHDYFYFTRRAAALAGLERIEQACQAYDRALHLAQAETERKPVLEALIYLERKSGQPERAIAYLEEMLKLSPRDPVWLREKAVVHYLKKERDAALAAMLSLPRESLTAQDHFFIANVQLEKQAYAEATSEYETTLLASVGDDMRYKAYMGLGYAYAGNRDMLRARAAFAKAIDIKPAPDANQALRNVTRMLHAASYHPPASPAIDRVEVKRREGSSTADVNTEAKPRAQFQRPRRVASSIIESAGERISAQADDAKMAYALVAEGKDKEAAAAFRRAVEAGGGSEQLYLDAGFAEMRLKEWSAARDNFLLALQYSRSLKNILYVARSHVATNQPEAALQYFLLARKQMRELPKEEQKTILLEIGHLYARRQDYVAAETAWKEAHALAADVETLLNIADAQDFNGETGAALDTLAQIDESTLAPSLKLRLYAQLARANEKRNRVGMARDYMLRAAEIEPTAIRYYQVGIFELKHKQQEASIRYLRKAFEPDPENLAYAEQLAYLYKNGGLYAEAEKMFKHVIENDPARTALLKDLAYTYKQQGNNEAAISWFKRSIDAEYAERRESRLAKAGGSAAVQGGESRSRSQEHNPAQPEFDAEEAARLARAAAREAVSADAQESDGIANDVAATVHDDESGGQETSAGQFRYVSFHSLADSGTDGVRSAARGEIFGPLAQGGNAEIPAAQEATVRDRESIKEGQDEEIYRMRQEVRELSRRFQLNVYQSYRAKSQSQSAVASTPPGFFNSGAIPSQGGTELVYQPPGIGYQDGKVFQVFTRMLWSNQPESLRIDRNSLQAGIGARYKPFRTQDMFASIERLVKVGDQSQSDWLARLSYAWTTGYELKLNQSSWNQTLFYSDLGYFFPNAGVTALYSELRQGRSFNYRNRLTVTPHLLLAGRGQRPDPQHVSYLEGGAGVALKILFNENRYAAERSSLEFLAQYRKGLNHQHVGGWTFTVAASF